MITKAIIPAAGKGTRLYPITKAYPKELIALGSKTVLDHILDEISLTDVTEVLFIISPQKEAIRTYFGDSNQRFKFDYIYQTQQNGLADAVNYGRDFADDKPFLLVLPDSIIYTNNQVHPTLRVIKAFEENNASGSILVQAEPYKDLHKYGIVKPIGDIDNDSIFEIDGLVEKPKPENAPSKYSIAGRYVFNHKLFNFIAKTNPGANGEYQLTDSIALMLQDECRVWCAALEEDEIRRDIGTFEVYYDAWEIELAKIRNDK